MSVIRLAPVIVALLVAPPARAGIFQHIGHDVAEGIEPVLASTLADVDRRLATHEDRIEDIATRVIGKTSDEVGVRLEQVDGILEKRLLQVQLGTADVIAGGLDRIDTLTESRLKQLDASLDTRIKQVESATARTLDRANDVLAERTADLGRTVTAAVDHADAALAARIEQLDEVAGRRLGNVDVIASKQRLGLERTVVRTTWVIAAVIFLGLVLRALWSEYLAREAEIATEPSPRRRAIRYVRELARPLVRHALVGAAVALVLWQLPDRLPMAASRDAANLVAQHQAAAESAYQRLDWTAAAFHASQLQFLDADSAPRYQVLAAKAELLRDYLGRPTALMTPAGLAGTMDRVRTIERLLKGQLDPDLTVVRAAVQWQSAGTRVDERRAASLAAQALRSTPRGFVLAGLARSFIESQLQSPSSETPAELETNQGLRATLTMAPADGATPAFATRILLSRLMRELETSSTAHYLAMTAAHAGGQRDVRTREAQAVVGAWSRFDEQLRTNGALQNDAEVLAIFRLDDVPLTHARWYAAQPETSARPPALATLKARPTLAVTVAPARVVWARRYAGLMDGPARALVALQEARRYEIREAATLTFEESVTRTLAAPGDCDALRRASEAAASLGLFEASKDNERQAVAKRLLGEAEKACGKEPAAEMKRRVESALEPRGPRLI